MLGEVCTKPVVTVSLSSPVAEAARLMRATRVGAVVVVDSGRPYGILTDRDIAMDVVAEGRDASRVLVGEIMRTSPAVVREDQDLLDATRLFAEKGVRRLPVVNRSGKLMGIIALDDVLMLLGGEFSNIVTALAQELGRTPLEPLEL